MGALFAVNKRLVVLTCACYVSALAIAGALAAASLLNQEHSALNRLRPKCMFVQPGSAPSPQLVAWVQNALGTPVVDVTTPMDKQYLPAVTSRVHRCPAVLAADGTLVEGEADVEAFFASVADFVAPYRSGLLAVIITIGISLTALIMSFELASVTTLMAILGGCGLALSMGGCPQCGGSSAISLASVGAGLIVVLIAVRLFSGGGLFGYIGWYALLVLAMAVPFVQMVMLSVSPKLCFGCLAFTFVGSSIGFSTWVALARGEIRGGSIGWAGGSVTTIAVAVALLGYMSVGAPLPGGRGMPNLVGRQIALYANGYVSDGRGNVVLIALPACAACARAESALRSRNTRFSKLYPCGPSLKTHCFESKGDEVVAPVLLFVDGKGIVQYQYNGWPQAAASEEALVRQVKEMEEKP